jgi:hypothetical protein
LNKDKSQGQAFEIARVNLEVYAPVELTDGDNSDSD